MSRKSTASRAHVVPTAPAVDPELAAAAAEFRRRLDALNELDESNAGRAYVAGEPAADRRNRAVRALERANEAMLDELRASGLSGVVVEGRLYVDLGACVPNRSGSAEMAEAFELGRIGGLGVAR